MLPTTITNFRQRPTPANIGQDQIMFLWDLLDGAASYTLWRGGEEWYPGITNVEVVDDVPQGAWFDYPIDFNTPYSYQLVAHDSEGVAIAQSAPIAAIQYGGTVLTPFATVADLTTYWKAPDNAERALMLLNLASVRLRGLALPSINLDEKAALDPNFKEIIKWVVMEAVKRAMQAPQDLPPVETYGMTAGPYSENFKYTNPTGDLWFKKSELLAIGLGGGRQKLSSIRPVSRREIYPDTELEV